MSDEIRADYNQLEQVSSRFQNQSQSIEQMCRTVQASMQKLESGWVGEGSQAFFQEMQSTILPAVNRLQTALSNASQATGTIAQTVKQAEEEASAPFRS
jgi:WXG100 family type VII secretion target